MRISSTRRHEPRLLYTTATDARIGQRGASHAFFPSVTAVASALAERLAPSKGIQDK